MILADFYIGQLEVVSEALRRLTKDRTLSPGVLMEVECAYYATNRAMHEMREQEKREERSESSPDLKARGGGA